MPTLEQPQAIPYPDTLPVMPAMHMWGKLGYTHLVKRGLWHTQDMLNQLIPEALSSDPDFSHLKHELFPYWPSHMGETAKTPWSAFRREAILEEDNGKKHYDELEQRVLSRGSAVTSLLVTASSVALPEGTTKGEATLYLNTVEKALFGKSFTVAEQDIDTHKDHVLTFARNVAIFLEDNPDALPQSRHEDFAQAIGGWRHAIFDHLAESAKDSPEPGHLLSIAGRIGACVTKASVIAVADVGFHPNEELDSTTYRELLRAAEAIGTMGGVEIGYWAKGHDPVVGFRTALQDRNPHNPEFAKALAKEMRDKSKLDQYHKLQELEAWRSAYSRDSFDTITAFISLASTFESGWRPYKKPVWDKIAEPLRGHTPASLAQAAAKRVLNRK